MKSDPKRLFSPPSVVASLLAVFLLTLGCFGLPLKEQHDYGLARISIDVEPEQLGLLNSQIQSKRPVKGEAEIPGRWQGDCRVSFAGRSSLDNYRKSLELGDCDELFNSRTSLRVSAQSVDQTMLRSRLGYPIFAALQLEVPRAESVSAYLNRDYMGLYLLLELVDREFFETRGYDVKDIYKARYGNAGFKPEFNNRIPEAFSYEGKPDDFTLMRVVYDAVVGISDDRVFYQTIDRWLDIDSFLRYTAAAIFMCHWDGMNNNYYLVLDKRKQKLFVVPWDLDRIWERNDLMDPDDFADLNLLFERLLQIPESRQRLRQILNELETQFPLSRLLAEVDKLGAETAAAYSADPSLSKIPQEEALGALKGRIEDWYGEVQSFNERLLSPP